MRCPTTIKTYTFYNAGFSLLEVIMYLALFSFIMAAFISSAVQLIGSASHDTAEAAFAEEGDFLLAKVHWALANTPTITLPQAGAAAPELSLGEDMLDLTTLANRNVTLSNIFFYHAAAMVGMPESVGVRFTLTGRTPEGRMLTQDFFATTSLLY